MMIRFFEVSQIYISNKRNINFIKCDYINDTKINFGPDKSSLQKQKNYLNYQRFRYLFF